MKPGVTAGPVASSTVVAVAAWSDAPTWTMRPSRTATSARRGAAPVPSNAVPPETRTSYGPAWSGLGTGAHFLGCGR